MTATTAEVIGWCRGVLSSLGFTTEPAHLIGPVAWAYAEGGWSANAAAYNCWNTTLTMPGSVPINSVDVQAYRTISSGISATVETLRNGYYSLVITALAGGTPDRLAVAVGASPWGTSAAGILACIPRATAALVIPAPPPVPAPPPSTFLEALAMTTGAMVRFLYRFLYYREADPDGFAAQVAFLKGGGTLTELIANMQDAPEGRACIAAQRKVLALT